MSSNCEAILRASRPDLSDRTSSVAAETGTNGPICVTRIDDASVCVLVRFCFSTSLGSSTGAASE